MRKVLAVTLLLLMLISMVGCVAKEPPELSSTPTTEPTAEPTTEPSTEPTEEKIEYLSYEEFFAEERTLNRIYSNNSGDWIDGQYRYVQDDCEIVQVERSSGNKKVLYSGGKIMGWLSLYKEGVMYFAAREQDAIKIYRLYIPEQKLDILYDQIPTNIPNYPWFLFIPPETNLSEIGWKILNPEMIPHVNKIMEDRNNKYIGGKWWHESYHDWENHNEQTFSHFIHHMLPELEEKYSIPYRIVGFYDYVNDVYTQREENLDEFK